MPWRCAWRAVIGIVLVFMLAPLVLVVLFAFSSNPLIGFPLQGPTLRWFAKLAGQGEFWTALRTSLSVAASVAVLSTGIGTLTAFGLLRMPARLRSPLLTLIVLPSLLPPLLLAVALTVFFVRLLGLTLSPLNVVAGHLLIALPFVVLVVLARMARFDAATVEAARDLGATHWQSFRRVVLPEIAPALVGAALIAAAISLDDFLIAAFTIGSGNTLSTLVWGRLRTSLDPSINAIGTILLASTIGATAIALRLTRYRG